LGGGSLFSIQPIVRSPSIIFIDSRLFENGKESSFFHILAAVDGHDNRFVCKRVTIKLVRTFGTLENKTVLLQYLDKMPWLKFIPFGDLKNTPTYCCRQEPIRPFRAILLRKAR